MSARLRANYNVLVDKSLAPESGVSRLDLLCDSAKWIHIVDKTFRAEWLRMEKNNFGLSDFSDFLAESKSKENTREFIGLITFFLMAVVAVAIYLWRCQFGVDLTDEAFYSLPAWKLFQLGDRPFTDEIFNGLRHSDLLNYFFVRPWVPFSILHLRWAAVLFYSLILFWFVARCFSKDLGFTAGLVFAGCLTFDYFLMPTWSYNWWCRNLILVHHGLLLLAWEEKSARGKKFYIAGAGASMGLLIVAYNSLAPAFLVGAAGFVLLPSAFFGGVKFKKLLFPYISLGALILLADACYLLSPSVQGDWWLSVKAMASMSEYSSGSALIKATKIFTFVARQPELWILVACLFLLSSESPWSLVLRKVPVLSERLRDGIFILAAVALTGLSVTKTGAENTLGLYSALGIAGGLLVLLWAWYAREGFHLILVATSLAIIFGMGVSSTNQHLALYWGLPSILIPFVALHTRETTLRLRPLSQKGIWREAYGQGLVVLALGFLALGAFNHQRLHTYYDVPPGNCTSELSIPPLVGLKTSPRRAYLVQRLDALVSGKNYILGFAELPGVYYFSKVRASVDTTIVEAEAPFETNRRSIARMWARKRLPEVIVRAKVHPWYWGIHHPFAHEPLFYPSNDPYTKFAECARGKSIVNYEEFDAYEISRDRIESCVKSTVGPFVARK